MMRRTTWVIASVLALAASACSSNSTGAGASPSPSPPSVAPSSTVPPVASDTDFDPANFSNPTQVTNPYFSLVPGTRFTWKGHALDEGELIKREIEFTVTDMTKVIDGVETVVAWDRDFTDGALEEVELTFFAQDDDGTVWYFGEYPEEYDGKKLVKSPVWLGGLHEARTGITMQALPRLGTPDYAEGWGGTDVDWTDRGKVDQVGIDNCVPVDCYSDVVVIDEFNPDEPGKHQLKYYAADVGGIRTGWRGNKEDEQEELALVSLVHLSSSEMEEVRQAVLDQEARAYDRSPDVYGQTEPIRQR